MSNAFAPIVRARPTPIFGRPVHQGSLPLITARYFSSNPSDSGSLRTPCPPTSRLAGRRGITPVFGYSAPHPSAGGTLTLLIHALPSAQYGPIRPNPLHRYSRLTVFAACASPFSSGDWFLQFRVKACAQLAPPIRRPPSAQSSGFLRTCLRRRKRP